MLPLSLSLSVAQCLASEQEICESECRDAWVLNNFVDYMFSALEPQVSGEQLARRSHRRVSDPGMVDLFCTKSGSTYCASEIMSASEFEALSEFTDWGDSSSLTTEQMEVRECVLVVALHLCCSSVCSAVTRTLTALHLRVQKFCGECSNFHFNTFLLAYSDDFRVVPDLEEKDPYYADLKDLICLKDGEDWCMVEFDAVGDEISGYAETTSDRMEVSECVLVGLCTALLLYLLLLRAHPPGLLLECPC